MEKDHFHKGKKLLYYVYSECLISVNIWTRERILQTKSSKWIFRFFVHAESLDIFDWYECLIPVYLKRTFLYILSLNHSGYGACINPLLTVYCNECGWCKLSLASSPTTMVLGGRGFAHTLWMTLTRVWQKLSSKWNALRKIYLDRYTEHETIINGCTCVQQFVLSGVSWYKTIFLPSSVTGIW